MPITPLERVTSDRAITSGCALLLCDGHDAVASIAGDARVALEHPRDRGHKFLDPVVSANYPDHNSKQGKAADKNGQRR